MADGHRQLTKAQLMGMLLLGVCSWALIIGVIYAFVSNFLTGLIVVGTAIVAAIFLLWWLVYINDHRE
jgi:hypothetical protein